MRRALLGYGPIAVLALGAAAIAYLILSAALGGGSGTYVVNATFADAGGVLKNYTVKVANVKAGSVERISLDKHDDVVVRMELDKGAAPIGRGASAKVRPVNLLGEKYIDLDVGDQTHPLPSGSTIPRSRTSSPTELDDVLNTLDPGTRAGLRIMINEAGLGMAGRGANFNAVLEDLPPALDQARRVVGEVARENQALDRLIVRGDRVVASVDRRRDELGQLVGSAGDALGVVAERRRELGQTVRVAPAAFGRLAATLGRVRGAADQLTPAARDLRATAPALAATLARAPAFAKDAQATLAEARDVAPALSRLGRRSTPILKRLEPTAARLADFSAGARKLLDAADQGQGLSKFLDFMNGWVGVIGNADGLGHVFRLRLTFDDQFFTSAIRRYLGEYGAGKRRSPKAQAVRQALEQVQHTLDEHRDKLPEAVRRRLPKQAQELPAQVTKALGDALGGATGSTPQTGDLAPVLDYMLGS